jgi:hypothetical protein
MELPARPDGLRKPVPRPASHPKPQPIDSTTRRLVIRYADSLTGKKARPPHVREALIFWQVFPAQQAEVTLEDLVHTTSSNTTPFTIDFTDEQRGHYFYFAMQWVNTENKGGPTGDVYHKIIS